MMSNAISRDGEATVSYAVVRPELSPEVGVLSAGFGSVEVGAGIAVAVLVTAALRMRSSSSSHLDASAPAEEGAADWLDVLPTDTRFCPVCRSEFVFGTESCEDCGADLLDEDDLPADDPPVVASLVSVCRFIDPVSIQLARAVLEQSRIHCFLFRSGPYSGVENELFVYEDDVLRAKKLVSACLAQIHGDGAA